MAKDAINVLIVISSISYVVGGVTALIAYAMEAKAKES